MPPILQNPQIDERLHLDRRMPKSFRRLEAVSEFSSSLNKAKYRWGAAYVSSYIFWSRKLDVSPRRQGTKIYILHKSDLAWSRNEILLDQKSHLYNCHDYTTIMPLLSDPFGEGLDRSLLENFAPAAICFGENDKVNDWTQWVWSFLHLSILNEGSDTRRLCYWMHIDCR